MSGALPPGPACLLLQLLRHPQRASSLSLGQWDLALRQASGAGLDAWIATMLEDSGQLGAVPAQVREHAAWARRHAARHAQAVRWEVACIRAALVEAEVVPILLKGAAYVVADLPAARGRIFSDVDILVPHAALGRVEGALLMHGWVGGDHDEYDQRYYRQWMHELPPMEHRRRGSVIDVHHAILPATAASRPDPAALRGDAHDVPGVPGVRVLAPADMVIHSAVHLFYEGELNHGLRDLLDLHRLLLHFGAGPDTGAAFWEHLAPRAAALEAARPLFYALRYTRLLLGTPVPPATAAAAEGGRPNPLLLAVMDQLYGHALLPDHHSCDRPGTALARFLLYIRGNWLRMPPLMLARHLFHKAFLSPRAAARTDAEV